MAVLTTAASPTTAIATTNIHTMPALSNQEPSVQALCGRLADLLQERGWMLATAESCTGGLVAAACTALAGSSAWFERGVVTYSNDAKAELLGVAPDTIARCGAVSEPVARAMATGAVDRARAQVALAVTGIAGPGGATPGKPVGTVWFAWQVDGRSHAAMQCFGGDRAAVRAAAVQYALAELVGLLQAAPGPTTGSTGAADAA